MSYDKNRNSATSPLNTLSYVDAHLHLADPGYAGKVTEVVEDAGQHNVNQMLSNAVDYESSLETIRLAIQFPGRVLAAVGVHPFTATKSSALDLGKFGGAIDDNAGWVKAIGEIGLDGKYTQDEHIKAKQKEAFRFFLGLAEERKLPVVVHSRGAVPETLSCLADYRIPRVLLHWYDGPIEALKTIKERGYLISIGPALLYSRRIQQIASMADPSMILSETDGPVLYRGLFEGQLTLPSHVVDVVRKLADVKGVSSEIMRSRILSSFQLLINP